MKTTPFVFRERFEIRSAQGNLLQMARLYRFRYADPVSSEMEDYVAAMETKHAPFYNQPAEYLDVFKLDAITGAPLWIPLENEAVYAAARSYYDGFQSAGFFLKEHRTRLCRKYDAKQILPYLEELEMAVLSQKDPRETALILLSSFNTKHKALKELHKEMCSAVKCDEMRAVADKLILALWAAVDGLETAKQLLSDISVRNNLLNGLYEKILMDLGGDFRMRYHVRDYILHTYWAKPYFANDIRVVSDDYVRKAILIKELLDRYDRVGSTSLKREDILALYLESDWQDQWRAYSNTLFHTEKEM